MSEHTLQNQRFERWGQQTLIAGVSQAGCREKGRTDALA